MIVLFLTFVASLLRNSDALSCPSASWTPFEATGSCYLPVHLQTNYYTAEAYCNILGGNVASVTSINELFFVNSLFGGSQYWIGIRRQSGTWFYTDSSIAYYFNWRSSQPDGCCGSDVTCAIANYVDRSGTWDDTGCQNTWNGFVCKTAGTGGSTTIAPTFSCAANWTPFSATRSCYLAMRQQSNYYNADLFCRMMGGYVASITSAAEMSFVNGLHGGMQYWIGLRRQSGIWTWENSTMLTYSNWRSSQPDGCCGADVTCVIANYVDYSGTWDDTGCQNTWNGFVCKAAGTIA